MQNRPTRASTCSLLVSLVAAHVFGSHPSPVNCPLSAALLWTEPNSPQISLSARDTFLSSLFDAKCAPAVAGAATGRQLRRLRRRRRRERRHARAPTGVGKTAANMVPQDSEMSLIILMLINNCFFTLSIFSKLHVFKALVKKEILKIFRNTFVSQTKGIFIRRSCASHFSCCCCHIVGQFNPPFGF